jgi:hypothetical protein
MDTTAGAALAPVAEVTVVHTRNGQNQQQARPEGTMYQHSATTMLTNVFRRRQGELTKRATAVDIAV